MTNFVDQLVFDDGKGDCLRACVASVLGLPSSELPNFAECGFFDGLDEWLSGRGLRAIRLHFGASEDRTELRRAYVEYTDELVVLWGDSPRTDTTTGKRKQHAIVGRPKGYGFEAVHDPHPSRDGLHGDPYGVMWIVPKRILGEGRL